MLCPWPRSEFPFLHVSLYRFFTLYKGIEIGELMVKLLVFDARLPRCFCFCLLSVV